MIEGRTPAGTHWNRTGVQDGWPLVLIHGLGLDSSTWDAHLPLLAERQDVIRYDLLGHGRSADAPADLALRSYGAQVVELLDALEVERAHLVGFSLGGMINRRVALDTPERVASLLILNSPHRRGDDAQRLVEERAAASAAGGPGATIDATLERWFTPTFRAEPQPDVERVRATVLSNDLEQYAAARWVLAHGVRELIAPDPPITHPALVMTCEHDSGSTPGMAAGIAAEIAGAQLDVVPGLQHLGLLEDPDRFVEAILGFVDGLSDR